MTKFSDLGLSPALVRAIESKGYTTPTPIQAQAIPPLLAGRDLVGVAQTGTGKTAAFALPILNALLSGGGPAKPRKPRALVLAPTRELASQIAESFRVYGAGLVRVAVVFGGVKYGAQIRTLGEGVDVLVAAPGRLLDLMGERHVDLSAVEHFVLDEADQMLDLGFLPPIRKIVARLPQRRQNLFFSATMPPEIRRLAAELLKDPAEVAVAPPATTIDRVRQEVLFVEADRKKALLSELFADSALCKTIVFTRTKRGADRVARHLEACGVEAAAIHGDKSQPQREKALLAFRNGALRALVATDIAARGIDISEVSHVINFELPNVPESYVHRIGRTARAGAAGIAVSLVSDDERQLLKDIQKTTRQTVPATDRRRDPHLAQMAAVDRAVAGPEAPRGARPQAAGPRRHGGGGRSEAPARGVRSAQPSGQGPRRRRGAGAGRAGG